MRYLGEVVRPSREADSFIRRGDFAVPGSLQLLLELREMVDACDVTHAVFRTNHDSTQAVPPEGAVAEGAGVEEAVAAGAVAGERSAASLAGRLKIRVQEIVLTP